MGEKTEEATSRRLRKAREEGDSGVSAHAAQSLAFVVAAVLVPSALGALASRATIDLRLALDRAAVPHALPRFDPADLAACVAALTCPVLGATGMAAAAAQMVQTGGVLAGKKIAPKLSRLDPVAGVRGLFSAVRLFGVVRALVAASWVCYLAVDRIEDHLADFANVVERPASVGWLVRVVGGELAWRVALVGIAIGGFDLLVVRRAWLRKLRMSKDEVKREHREAEGDPQVKAARDRAYHELVAQASVAQVRTATVVVVNPTHVACALRYRQAQGDEAPVVLARAEGEVATRIVREAQRHGVPVVRHVSLARALVELEDNQAIPEGLYEAVAEIFREIGVER